MQKSIHPGVADWGRKHTQRDVGKRIKLEKSGIERPSCCIRVLIKRVYQKLGWSNSQNITYIILNHPQPDSTRISETLLPPFVSNTRKSTKFQLKFSLHSVKSSMVGHTLNGRQVYMLISKQEDPIPRYISMASQHLFIRLNDPPSSFNQATGLRFIHPPLIKLIWCSAPSSPASNHWWIERQSGAWEWYSSSYRVFVVYKIESYWVPGVATAGTNYLQSDRS